jgi:hypothetical protein
MRAHSENPAVAGEIEEAAPSDLLIEWSALLPWDSRLPTVDAFILPINKFVL